MPSTLPNTQIAEFDNIEWLFQLPTPPPEFTGSPKKASLFAASPCKTQGQPVFNSVGRLRSSKALNSRTYREAKHRSWVPRASRGYRTMPDKAYPCLLRVVVSLSFSAILCFQHFPSQPVRVCVCVFCNPLFCSLSFAAKMPFFVREASVWPQYKLCSTVVMR